MGLKMTFIERCRNWFGESNVAEKDCCNDPTCRRKVKTNRHGKIYVENLLTCGAVKEQIVEIEKLELL